jgi:hypothetical protein
MAPPGRLEKIVSGGQTGVDRAALDAALALGLPCGGWCPKGRKAEDGPIPSCYPLQETSSADYAQRTTWNVRDADGTLVLYRQAPSEGTGFTIQVAARLERPCLALDLAKGPSAAEILEWIDRQGIRTLNVAGPRESGAPGIHAEALALLRRVLSAGRKEA